jgi:Ca2+/H+ antiporter, TMEM165/GDT1 family
MEAFFASIALVALAEIGDKTQLLGPRVLQIVLALSFLAMAAWMLVPDNLDLEEQKPRFGLFITTTLAFFVVEMGDKTQIATVALAAKYGTFYLVVAGTTLGMLLANAPVVHFGERILRVVPVRAVQRVTAALFAVLGILALAPLFR